MLRLAETCESFIGSDQAAVSMSHLFIHSELIIGIEWSE
jgi:hypothetical protein